MSRTIRSVKEGWKSWKKKSKRKAKLSYLRSNKMNRKVSGLSDLINLTNQDNIHKLSSRIISSKIMIRCLISLVTILEVYMNWEMKMMNGPLLSSLIRNCTKRKRSCRWSESRNRRRRWKGSWIDRCRRNRGWHS